MLVIVVSCTALQYNNIYGPVNMAASVVINEVLNYTVFNLKRVAKDSLLHCLAKFYHEDELYAAKTVLCKHVLENDAGSGAPAITAGWAKLVNSKGMPIMRKTADPAQRRQHEADDLLQMLILLDVNKVELPKFVADDLDRIPSAVLMVDSTATSPSGFASDFASLMSTFKTMMEDVLRSVERNMSDVVTKRLDDMERKLTGSSSYGSMPAPRQLVPETQGVQDTVSGQSTSLSWSDHAKDLGNADPSTVFKNITTKPRVRVRGQAATSSLKAVPRQLTCFVGRIHQDVTEEDLAGFLKDRGISDVRCRKLIPKDGRVFNTAAFRVSCSAEYESIFYDESQWPAGAELRDWVFYNRDGRQ